MDIAQFYDGYPFTHEQAQRIKEILGNKFDPNSVNVFIDRLRFCCEGAACLLDQPDYKTYKNDRKSMLAILEKSDSLLDAIRRGRMGLYHLSNYTILNNGQLSEESLECQEIAVTIDNLLRILIRKIKRFDEVNEQYRKKGSGRPSADNKKIGAEIVKIWEACFNEKPKKYQDGLFGEVLEIVLEGLYGKQKDPRRTMEDALR